MRSAKVRATPIVRPLNLPAEVRTLDLRINSRSDRATCYPNGLPSSDTTNPALVVDLRPKWPEEPIGARVSEKAVPFLTPRAAATSSSATMSASAPVMNSYRYQHATL